MRVSFGSEARCLCHGFWVGVRGGAATGGRCELGAATWREVEVEVGMPGRGWVGCGGLALVVAVCENVTRG